MSLSEPVAEVWVHVLSYVDVERVVNCVSFVSRGFYALATEPQLWHRLVRRYFPSVVNLYEGDPDGWRKTFIAQASSKRPRFCLLGKVDCGKSTLIGRILVGLGAATEQEVQRNSDEANLVGVRTYKLKYAWISDRLKLERERGITIDWHTRECTLSSGREIEIVDLPGHCDFIKNTSIGASMADVAILVASVHQYHINAGLTNVVPPEHLVLAKSANVSKVIVAVNRMDDPAVFHMSHSHFEMIKDCVMQMAAGAGFEPEDLVVLPISAWSGENVVCRPSSLPWYEGPMLFDVMEQAASRVVMKRSLFVLRRENVLCTGGQSGTKKPEEVVVVLVQSGMVREGQVLQAVLPGPIVCRRELVGLRLGVERVPAGVVLKAASGGAVRNRKAKWATWRLSRGVVLAAENALEASRIESFTVRLVHSVPMNLRCGIAPLFILHTASLPCRVEKIISLWTEGQEVPVEEDGKAAVIRVDRGMSTLVQVKPLGDVFVEPYARNAALGTVLVSDMGPITAYGRIESVFRHGQGTTS
ncbi:elongation factor Tu GTP binding domain containing protein [Acanthamoeba castellanii str. Neff]|uniref:Elongation factor Tu GTP binding domain containing protein n=1 Tax=Acanthamoeba castellanii (strain ATCC 30010 / Neff) TaxID=1257118 RepID=L8GPI0_ACACF|nr:elongation factor Tu GTP binding domain containing protein [Acanthamoeba castellanii str. Neff]ELR14827.1 elongation factor Tu GTP binding domain containing protein [Acanthamoeba castellanii str. Neff]